MIAPILLTWLPLLIPHCLRMHINNKFGQAQVKVITKKENGQFYPLMYFLKGSLTFYVLFCILKILNISNV